MHMKKVLFWLFSCVLATSSIAQSSSEIFHEVKKFNSFKSALYMAAHPDDENTRVIAWLENGELARTGYLSLTRGDGGQNLIGKELGPELGILRTQELLAARRIDGGDQFFTRAVDFGYSKSADESFEKWNREDILYDAVWVIRKFQPDVIITRFPPDRRGGHGHHTASAMLAIEAFEKAGDPNVFPDQLNDVQAWQPKAVYWNASTWWNRKLDSLARNNEDYIMADIGGYDELLGVSYNELGTMARSQHKCQGFGVRIERGERMEYFQWLAGNKLESSFFENSERSWRSLGGDGYLDSLTASLEQNYDFNDPSASLGTLIEIQNTLANLAPSTWTEAKRRECKKLIKEIAGLHVEVLTADYSTLSGENVNTTVEVLNRGKKPLKLISIRLNAGGETVTNFESTDLPINIMVSNEMKVDTQTEDWNPYWLNKPFTTQYMIDDLSVLGKPENDPMLMATLTLELDGQKFEVDAPAEYKWSDRVKGEMKRPVVNTPEIATTFLEKSFVFTSEEEKEISVRVKNYGVKGVQKIGLATPEGWEVTPTEIEVNFESKYEEQIVAFTVVSPKKNSKGEVSITVNGKPSKRIEEIMYDHIPAQLVFLPANATLLNLVIDIEEGKVGYVEGAGDQVGLAIEQMGYEVVYLSKEDLSTQDLNQYQAIITGIRAYNVHPWLMDFHSRFMDYVKQGGNFIIQYNTRSRSYNTDKMGPYPFKISRDRVSEEDAIVSFIDPKHGLLNEPNKIRTEDFDGWVQERGLYFANEWDNKYETLFSWNDKGESPKMGALIYAPYGEGSFVYTGISFFRELPAGVPGAFKLLANLISHESDE